MFSFNIQQTLARRSFLEWRGAREGTELALSSIRSSIQLFQKEAFQVSLSPPANYLIAMDELS